MIVITGGAGFIGSNLVAALEAQGEENLVVCDVLGSSDKWRNLAKRGLRDFVHPDVLFDYLETNKKEVTAIFHMGAISSTTEKDADLIMKNNFILTRDLWRWCGANKVRFIYASSAATYGDGEQGFKDDDTIDFLGGLRPLNPYGWSKHLFDRSVADIIHRTRSEATPPQWAGLKFFNVYGPNEYHKGDQMSVICKLYPQVAAGAAARLFKSYHPSYGDGGQLRDFVYVDDCVSVMLWLYQNPKVSGLFNVGTGKARSFKDLALATFSAAEMEPKINFTEMPEDLKGKYQYHTQADMSKLRAAGYTAPFIELEEGVRQYVQHFMAQTDQYR